MANCNLRLKAKIDLKQALNKVEKSFSQFMDGFFSELKNVLDKVDDIADKFTDVADALNSEKFREYVKNASNNIASASSAMVIKFFQLGGDVIKQALTAYTLINLSDDLKKRAAILEELRVLINVIKTCLAIVKANIETVRFNSDIYNRIFRASRHVRTAIIKSRQLVAIWENSGVYDDFVFRQVERSLELAQDELIAPELQIYQDAIDAQIQKFAEENGLDYNDVNVYAALQVASAKLFNPTKASGRAAIALEPLYSLITGAYDNRIARIVFAFKIALSAIYEVVKLLPAEPATVVSIAKSSGSALSNASEYFRNRPNNTTDYFFNNAELDFTLDTLLVQNGRVLTKISALKNIGEKWYLMDNLSAPIIDYIDEATVKLSPIYEDMQETINTATTTSELYTKASIWSSDIADVQTNLLAVLPPVGRALEDATYFNAVWNYVLYEIDIYDTENDLAVGAFSDIMTSLALIPNAFTDGASYSQAITRLDEITYNIKNAIDKDEYLYDMIDELQLESTVPRIDAIQNMIDFCDTAFPVLAEILRNCDIDTLNKALEKYNLESESGINLNKLDFPNIPNLNIVKGLKNLGNSIKDVYKSKVEKEVVECLNTANLDIDIDVVFPDISLSALGFGRNTEDEETKQDVDNISNFYHNRVGAFNASQFDEPEVF